MIEWQDALTLGIEEIDDQHHVFLDLVERLDALSQTDATRLELRSVLAGLESCAKNHFTDEEDHMRRSGFPLLDHHVSQHKAALDKVRDLLDHDPGAPDTYRVMGSFLKAWLLNHIEIDDKEYADWLRLKLPAGG